MYKILINPFYLCLVNVQYCDNVKQQIQARSDTCMYIFGTLGKRIEPKTKFAL